ncbi:MAG: outer membrane protein insertion porin family [Candidatus Hydrogenedentes bacterium]|nr:outer membrane protein insertion porin family [Candidatus Hydrogenedentota bacterium]
MAIVTAFAPCLAAQEAAERNVDTVRIDGLERVSDQLVRAQLETQPGKPLNPRAVARDIRRLYEMGYFDHIQADANEEGGAMVVAFKCVEKRLIAEVKIVGCDKVRERNVRGVLSWKEGESFVADGYDGERDAVLKLYQSKGFPNTSVDIVVDEMGPGRVRVTYAITEGKKARIRSIDFEDNAALSDRKLRKIMKTRRAWWFLGGKYDETKFETDLDKIVEEYGNVGRLEAEVASTGLEYSPNGKRLDIDISLKEGPEYSVESLDIAQNEVFDDDELLEKVEVKAGDVHNKGRVAQDAKDVEKGYQDAGYVNAAVVEQTTLDREKKTTHVVHQVDEQTLKYIKEIEVAGNTVTKDEVIRRELVVMPEDRFDGTAVEASKNRVENTEYFDSVRMTVNDDETNDLYTNLMVDVEEGKTGNFNFGAGYSTEERLGAFTELRLNNFDLWNWPEFSGGGQQMSIKLNVGDIRDQYSLSFTDPELGGYPIAGGFDVFDESYRYRGGVEYTEAAQGGQLRLGKQLSPYVTARSSLRYTDYNIEDIPTFATPTLRRERGGSVTIANAWSISRNTLDRYRDPSKGARHELAVTLAGLGGDNEFTKYEHDSLWYKPFGSEEKWVLSFQTREGWVDEYGSSDYVPISDRFFAGGTTTVRGYDTRDIGPKEYRYWFFGPKDAIGGELRLVNNLEMKYKVIDKFRVYAFVDSGGVWETIDDFDFGDTKYSAGLGFGVEVPRLGPIRVDYGIPINPDDDQGSGRLHLLTGLRF